MSRRISGSEAAGAETIGAVLLFGIFVATIALLNVTSVPRAGLAAEDTHIEGLLDDLNALQTDAEIAGVPGKTGATVARGLALSPSRNVGQDFFSFFLATPARATGQLTYVQDHGNVTLTHHKGGGPNEYVDIGSTTARFTTGRLTFDPHPIFRDEGIFQLENGGLVATRPGTSTMRFDPPVAVTVEGTTTHLAVKARIFNGTDFDLGGATSVRVGLLTEAATLSSPTSNNARDATYRIETSYGAAWGEFFNQTASAAGLDEWTGGAEVGYNTTVERAAGEAGLDIVTWRVFGTAAGGTNDIRLTYGLAIYRVSVS